MFLPMSQHQPDYSAEELHRFILLVMLLMNAERP